MRRETRRSPPPSFTPFRDFVGPARRRTDNPLVVGTIILCLGLLTLSAIIQVTATFWAGSRIHIMLKKSATRDAQTDAMRGSIIKHSEAQAVVLRRLCLNVAKTDEDKQECLAFAPPVSPSPTKGTPR